MNNVVRIATSICLIAAVSSGIAFADIEAVGR
jgi:hypothetical protein